MAKYIVKIAGDSEHWSRLPTNKRGLLVEKIATQKASISSELFKYPECRRILVPSISDAIAEILEVEWPVFVQILPKMNLVRTTLP